MNFENIINPKTGKSYSIFSKKGKHILKQFIRIYKKGGVDMTNFEGTIERQRVIDEEIRKQNLKNEYLKLIQDIRLDGNSIDDYRVGRAGQRIQINWGEQLKNYLTEYVIDHYMSGYVY